MRVEPFCQGGGVSVNELPPVVLLSGGLGTRLGKVTASLPKALIEVAGKPFIAWQLEWLKRQGITRVVVCIGHCGERIEETVGSGARFGLDVCYSNDGPVLLGTAGAIVNAFGLLPRVFWVMYGDSYLPVDFKPVYDFFVSRNARAVMTVMRNENRWDASNVVFEQDRVVVYDKRKGDSRMRYIDYGLSLLAKDVFEGIPAGQAADLAEVFAGAAGQGCLWGFEVNQRFYEIGSPDGLKQAGDFLSRGMAGTERRV